MTTPEGEERPRSELELQALREEAERRGITVSQVIDESTHSRSVGEERCPTCNGSWREISYPCPDDFHNPTPEPPAEEQARALAGLPPDLVRILRDQSVVIERDLDLWQQIAEWRNAPSLTASADFQPSPEPPAEEGERTPSWVCESCGTVRTWDEAECYYCGSAPPISVPASLLDEARRELEELRRKPMGFVETLIERAEEERDVAREDAARARRQAEQVARNRSVVNEHELEDDKAARLLREAEESAAHLAGRLVESEFARDDALARAESAESQASSLREELAEWESGRRESDRAQKIRHDRDALREERDRLRGQIRDLICVDAGAQRVWLNEDDYTPAQMAMRIYEALSTPESPSDDS